MIAVMKSCHSLSVRPMMTDVMMYASMTRYSEQSLGTFYLGACTGRKATATLRRNASVDNSAVALDLRLSFGLGGALGVHPGNDPLGLEEGR